MDDRDAREERENCADMGEWGMDSMYGMIAAARCSRTSGCTLVLAAWGLTSRGATHTCAEVRLISCGSSPTQMTLA